MSKDVRTRGNFSKTKKGSASKTFCEALGVLLYYKVFVVVLIYIIIYIIPSLAITGWSNINCVFPPHWSWFLTGRCAVFPMHPPLGTVLQLSVPPFCLVPTISLQYGSYRSANLQICILYIYSTSTGTEYFKHALYSPFFSLHNAVRFIMLTCLVPVLFTFYIQNVLK